MSTKQNKKKKLTQSGISGSELVNMGVLPNNFHLDDGDNGDVGNYIDGRKGESSIKRIGGLSVPKNKTDWWKRMSESLNQ